MANNKQKILAISLLSIPLSAGVALVPVLSDIAGAFPDQAGKMQLLITLPSLFMMFSSLLTDRWSKKSSLKFITQISIVLIAFSGLSPYWISSFSYLLFTRALMGIGLGLLNTVIASLPALYFADSGARDHAAGIQSAFVCVGGIAFNLLSGTLARYNWRAVFLVQLINLLPLLSAIFFMPATDAQPGPVNGRPKLFVKDALPVVVIGFITIVLTCTYPLNLSLFVEKRGLGDSQFVGLLTGLNSVIGFGVGLIFGRVYATIKARTLPMGLGLVAVALLIAAHAPSRAVLLLGSLAFGVGTSFISPSFYAMLYQRVRPEEVVSSVAMLGIAINVSQFVSPFVINPMAATLSATGTEEARFITAGVLVCLLLIILYWQSKRKTTPA